LTNLAKIWGASVVDPHHFDADADRDSTYNLDDPDSDFYLMRIWMRIQIFI
jgi:hypothetical protein